VGKGTGMGLSISYQIINDRHHGKLWCKAAKDGGTEFVLEIPIHLNANPSFLNDRFTLDRPDMYVVQFPPVAVF
jgi:signal transduction histidine kinase